MTSRLPKPSGQEEVKGLRTLKQRLIRKDLPLEQARVARLGQLDPIGIQAANSRALRIVVLELRHRGVVGEVEEMKRNVF